MNTKEGIESFVKRLAKIGIKVELESNYPWIYLKKINGEIVIETFEGNHGFTIAFYTKEFHFTDIEEIFKLIRKYL